MTAFDVGVATAPQAWVWTIRGADLIEIDGPVDGYAAVQAVLGDGAPGTLSLTVPLNHWSVPYLLTEGWGLVARRRGSSDVICSGTINQQDTVYQPASDGGDQVTVTGPTDESLLASEVAWADPTHWLNDVAGTNVLSGSVDARSGPAETVLLGYVKANMGSTAFHSGATTPPIDRRRNAWFTIPASAGRGTSGSYQANFDTLLDIATVICRTGGITWTIRQASAGTVAMAVRARADKSADVVFSRRDGSVNTAKYTRVAPTVTRGIAVSDDGSSRSYAMAIDTAAETLWGQSWTTVGDGSSSVIADLLQSAGDLIAGGLEQAGGQLEPVVLPGGVQFGDDYQLGDLVTVVDGNGTSIVDRLTQVSYQHAAGSAPTLTPSVGISQEDQDSALVPLLRQITAQLRARRLR